MFGSDVIVNILHVFVDVTLYGKRFIANVTFVVLTTIVNPTYVDFQDALGRK